MQNVAQNENASKAVRVPEETWKSAAHEAIERDTSISAVMAVAWKRFMALPVSARIEAVEQDKRTLAA